MTACNRQTLYSGVGTANHGVIVYVRGNSDIGIGIGHHSTGPVSWIVPIRVRRTGPPSSRTFACRATVVN